MQFQKSKSFRRNMTSSAMIAWPLAMLFAAVVQPNVGDSPTDVYSAAVSHSNRLSLSLLIGIPGIVFWLIAVSGITNRIQERGSVLAIVGGILAALGALGHMVNASLFLVLLGIPSSGHEGELVPAVDRIANHVFPVAMPMLMLGAIGVFLLGLALYRGGFTSKATPILLALSIVVEFIHFPGITGDVVTWALVGTGLALSIRGVRGSTEVG